MVIKDIKDDSVVSKGIHNELISKYADILAIFDIKFFKGITFLKFKKGELLTDNEFKFNFFDKILENLNSSFIDDEKYTIDSFKLKYEFTSDLKIFSCTSI
eukprot:GHVR01110820.1.p1 GENE.GHVR01110820.1~~GHVR01110820.1.p1  ORF type:complete len:118 (+),score=21.02 GHVR01110820.1:54-356(+)